MALATDNMAAYFDGIALTSFFEDLFESGMQWTVGAGAGWVINAQTNVLQQSDLSQTDSGEFYVLRGQASILDFVFLVFFNQEAWVRFPPWTPFFFPSEVVGSIPAAAMFFFFKYVNYSSTHPLIVLIYTLRIQRGCDVWEQ